MNQSNRRGISIIESIVACLCLGSLMMIGLPALQNHREQARNTRCANRLRELALAGHHFHDANKRLPPATVGAKVAPPLNEWLDEDNENHWKNFQNTSSLALTMPFAGLHAQYQSINPDVFNFLRNLNELVDVEGRRLYQWQGDIESAVNVAMTFEDLFTCPSDDINIAKSELSVVIASQPVLNEEHLHDDIGIRYWEDAMESKRLGRTNYTACGGVLGGAGAKNAEMGRWSGCMTSGQRVTLETILDGTSRTIMYGETIGQIDDSTRSAARSWFWSGFSRGRGDIPYLAQNDPDHPDRRLIGDSRWSSNNGFGSKHSNGMNAVFADGSVHYLSRDIDFQAFYELCGASDGGTPLNWDAAPEFPTRDSDDPAPIVEKFLIAGELNDGEVFLENHLQTHPDDDQARFGLGVLQFFQTVAQLGQFLYRYGAGANEDSSMIVQAIPFMRMPVPANPNPDPVGIEDVRQSLQTMIDNLQKVDQTLARIQSDEVKLSLKVGRFRLDLDGDGVCVETEGLGPILQFYTGGARLGTGSPQMEQLVIVFDKADVHWLRGYCHLLSAMAETMLAYDMEPVWNVFGHRLFAEARIPYEFLNRGAEQRSLDFELIIDAIAAIHNINFQLREADRMPRALEHLNTVITQSRLNWNAILAETDDDLEWIPGPQQSGVISNVEITDQMVATWREFLDEFQSLLDGKKLAPFWRGDDPALGINLKRVFTEPAPFDLVLWVHGSAAVPFLENGEVTSPETWSRFQQVFRGNFLGFAIWFN